MPVRAHERDGVGRGVFRGLVRINPKHHAAQEQRNVGRAHLVDKALRVLGTGEFLFKVRQAKAGVDALAQDAAQVLLALHDGHARAPALCAESAAAMPAGPPPITTTSNACVDTDATAPASARSSRISSVAILAHPLQRSLNQPRSGIL